MVTDTLERPATGKPTPVQLRTARDHSLVVQALEHRTEELEKLGKKTEEEGYGREARNIKADAGAIREYILPQFRTQQELPLATTAQVRAGIANALRDILRNALVVRAPQDKQEDALKSREEMLLEKLAIRIEAYAAEVAEAGYQAGIAAREAVPEAIALRHLRALTVSD